MLWQITSTLSFQKTSGDGDVLSLEVITDHRALTAAMPPPAAAVAPPPTAAAAAFLVAVVVTMVNRSLHPKHCCRIVWTAVHDLPFHFVVFGTSAGSSESHMALLECISSVDFNNNLEGFDTLLTLEKMTEEGLHGKFRYSEVTGRLFL